MRCETSVQRGEVFGRELYKMGHHITELLQLHILTDFHVTIVCGEGEGEGEG
jgi:hypothetical protein